MPDEAAGLLQNNLHTLVPVMIILMIDAEEGQAASAGRVKAAAMQLLPPLFDGLHVRRLSGCFREGQSIEEKHAQQLPFVTAVVSIALYAQASLSVLVVKHRTGWHWNMLICGVACGTDAPAHYHGARGRCGKLQSHLHPFGLLDSAHACRLLEHTCCLLCTLVPRGGSSGILGTMEP